MSRCGAQIRSSPEIGQAIEDAWRDFSEASAGLRIETRAELPRAFKAIELLLTHAVYLEAIGEYLAQGGQSRGSYLVLDPNGRQDCGLAGTDWRFTVDAGDTFASRHILEIRVGAGGRVDKRWVPVRPVPKVEDWFETVWKEYRHGDYLDNNGDDDWHGQS